MFPGFRFALEAGRRGPRAGVLATPRGDIPTPAFAPVATLGTVRAALPGTVRAAGAHFLLANAWHLSLRPGAAAVAAAGGLHRFSGWAGPILTDSGGFQIFSLGPLARVSEKGVAFRSPADGTESFLSPEEAVALQERLGADLVTVLDVCLPHGAAPERQAEALGLTHRWAARSLAARRQKPAFAIVQGGTDLARREESARFLAALGPEGLAVGGLSVGEAKADMRRVLDLLDQALPEDKPRYLMGVGSPDDLVEAAARGMDLFDCVLPTRAARHGALLVPEGHLNIRNQSFALDPRPVNESCPCPACRGFSRACLRHLFQSGEILGPVLATAHNLHFMGDFLARMRAAIKAGEFASFRADFLARWKPPVRPAGEIKGALGGRRRWAEALEE